MKPNYYKGDRYFTAFNHFIDIRKGNKVSLFDDYDGYSYERGSGKENQFQMASDATNDYLEWIIGEITQWKVDEGTMTYFQDEYVHAPGAPYYKE